MSAANEYQRLREQAESLDHHRRVLRTALVCLFAVLLIIAVASMEFAQ